MTMVIIQKRLKQPLKAARASHPDRRLVMLFQPHRFSRTRDCFDDFVDVLSQVDQLLLLKSIQRVKKPIVGADSRALRVVFVYVVKLNRFWLIQWMAICRMFYKKCYKQ